MDWTANHWAVTFADGDHPHAHLEQEIEWLSADDDHFHDTPPDPHADDPDEDVAEDDSGLEEEPDVSRP